MTRDTLKKGTTIKTKRATRIPIRKTLAAMGASMSESSQEHGAGRNELTGDGEIGTEQGADLGHSGTADPFATLTDLPLKEPSADPQSNAARYDSDDMLDWLGPLPTAAMQFHAAQGNGSEGQSPQSDVPLTSAAASGSGSGEPPLPKAPSSTPPSPAGSQPSKPATQPAAAQPPKTDTPQAADTSASQKEGADKAGGKADGTKDDLSPPYQTPDPVLLGQNLAQAAAQCQELLSEFVARQQDAFGKSGPDPYNLTGPFTQLLQRFMSDPFLIMRSQMELWQAQTALWQATMRRFMGEKVDPVVEPGRGDKRWRHPEWANNQIFDFMKQSYLLTTKWLQDTVHDVEGMDDDTKRRVEFYTKQMVDAFSPSNFVLTNPEVIEETMKSNGENLVRGLNNLLRDLERGKGELWIQQTDLDHFVVGENVATAPGWVVFQNDLFQLIQYAPTTETVYERPLLIFPPWINKYYILDLRPENSFIRWATDKGYTVFLVSWVNPDDNLAHVSFEDYLADGVIKALQAVRDATGAPDVNAIGYCIGGTLLTCALSYFAARGERPVNAATFFAAQTDFTESGELQVFIDEHQINSIENMVDADGGYLDGVKLANTFNLLRANDLIWSFVINNYLMGKDPKRFDLLYWNSDQTRLPREMVSYYLREFYRGNKLSTGQMQMLGEVLDMGKVDIPMYIQSSKEDHISPARSVFKATNLFSGDVRFVLSGSGHIAGVINHPDAKKYQYWINEAKVNDFDSWFAGAVETPGSWWPDWDRWLSKLSGERIPARVPGDGALDLIEPAPGSYVKVKSS